MTKKKPLVSVVINFLNAAPFIREAVESVFSQTYPSWELILVDDGSTDDSREISLEYARLHPEKVRCVEHPGHQNRGASASRNLGSHHASGDYIAFLDADDLWLPHKLEQQVAILASHPEAAMVYGRALYWYGWTGKPEDRQRDFVPGLGVPPNSLIPPPALITAFLQDEVATPFPSSMMVRRNMDSSIGGFEEAFRSIYDDQVYCAKLALQASVFASGEVWHWYRLHPNQRTVITTQTSQYHADRQAFLDWLEKYLSGQGFKDGQLWQVLQKQLWPFRHPRLSNLIGRSRQAAAKLKALLKSVAKRILPVSVRQWLRSTWQARLVRPPVGRVRFGNLRRLKPISRQFGLDRGLPIDRYYIEQFLSTHSQDIHGHVLEIGDDSYTMKFGRSRVTRSTVLHVEPGNSQATLVGDLATGAGIPAAAFDCMLLTQTFPFIFALPAAIANTYAALKPGGILLATLPGLSQISRYDMDRWGDYWRFTTLSARKLFEQVFPSGNITIQAHGNVLTATALLYGLAMQDLRPAELDVHDPDYEMLITVRAVKPNPAGNVS